MPPAPMSAIWIVSFGEYIAFSKPSPSLRSVPFHRAILKVADLRKQRRAGGAETEIASSTTGLRDRTASAKFK